MVMRYTSWNPGLTDNCIAVAASNRLPCVGGDSDGGGGSGSGGSGSGGSGSGGRECKTKTIFSNVAFQSDRCLRCCDKCRDKDQTSRRFTERERERRGRERETETERGEMKRGRDGRRALGGREGGTEGGRD